MTTPRPPDALPSHEAGRLAELQYPIDQRITNELIMSTPDTWSAIQLEVEVTWHADPEYLELGIMITSPEGRDASRAAPTDALFTAVEEMLRLRKQFGQALTRVVGTAKQDDKGWLMRTVYE